MGPFSEALVTSLAELDAYGVAFISLRDNLDLSTPSGRLMMQRLGSMAEFERALIQERVKAGLRNAKPRASGSGDRLCLSANRESKHCAPPARPGARSRKSSGLEWGPPAAPLSRVPKTCAGVLALALRRATMPSNPAKPFLVSRTDDPQLQRLNANIAKLAAAKPAGEAFGAFALAAHLADLAIEAALELGQMPGVDMKTLQASIKFWKVVRDQSRAAALACGGANHTLAGALVAFRLLRNIGGEETPNHAK